MSDDSSREKCSGKLITEGNKFSTRNLLFYQSSQFRKKVNDMTERKDRNFISPILRNDFAKIQTRYFTKMTHIYDHDHDQTLNKN